MLNVTDLDEAIGWYSKLNAELRWKHPSNEATHAGIKIGGINIMLALCNDSPEQIQKQNLYFVVEGIKAFRKSLTDHLEEELPPLVDTDYGMQDFSLRDPWGHLLTFGEEY